MAGRKEVIGHFQDAIKTMSWDLSHWTFVRTDIVKDAIALLQEQEPIKPTVSVDTWICSKCGHTLESQELIDDKENPQLLVHEQYEYCPCCGRKVEWNGLE